MPNAGEVKEGKGNQSRRNDKKRRVLESTVMKYRKRGGIRKGGTLTVWRKKERFCVRRLGNKKELWIANGGMKKLGR